MVHGVGQEGTLHVCNTGVVQSVVLGSTLINAGCGQFKLGPEIEKTFELLQKSFLEELAGTAPASVSLSLACRLQV
ncbi:MAG: hypothetical protein JWO35_486 [Candidatus Saccharibacteria bacterium]|nr:hypothetical protein [Candidatus Saccharibacteria bacterium]